MKLTGNRWQCPACKEHFNSVAAFDKHRSGPAEARICLNPAEIGMTRNAAGWWITAPMATKPAYLANMSREKRTIPETLPSDTPERKQA